MNTLRIGVMDKETPYVERLCAYLNRFGNGMWNAVAFTDEKVLKKQMHDRRVDLLMTTKQEIIEEMNKKYPERSYVWLTEEKRNKNFEVSVPVHIRFTSDGILPSPDPSWVLTTLTVFPVKSSPSSAVSTSGA